MGLTAKTPKDAEKSAPAGCLRRRGLLRVARSDMAHRVIASGSEAIPSGSLVPALGCAPSAEGLDSVQPVQRHSSLCKFSPTGSYRSLEKPISCSQGEPTPLRHDGPGKRGRRATERGAAPAVSGRGRNTNSLLVDSEFLLRRRDDYGSITSPLPSVESGENQIGIPSKYRTPPVESSSYTGPSASQLFPQMLVGAAAPTGIPPVRR
jgi:hypothetical protein